MKGVSMKKALIGGSIVVVLVVVGVVIYMMTAGNPDNVAYKLYEEADQLVTQADTLFSGGQLAESEQNYKQALEKAQTILQDYKETLSVDSAMLISLKCKRRLGAFGSPKEVVNSMIQSIGDPSADDEEYLSYWDFDEMSEMVLAEEWESLSEEKRARFAEFCLDGTHKIVGENSDVIQLVQVTMLKEEIDGNQAKVETQWDVKAANRSEKVPFLLKKEGELWKIYDFEIGVLGGGPAVLLRQGLDRCAAESSIEEFLGLPDFGERLEECYHQLVDEMQADLQGELTGSESPEKAGATSSAPKSKVTVECEVMQGDTAVGTIPEGAEVDILQEGESESMGKMFLISWDSETGPPLVGWVPATNVEKTEK